MIYIIKRYSNFNRNIDYLLNHNSSVLTSVKYHYIIEHHYWLTEIKISFLPEKLTIANKHFMELNIKRFYIINTFI